jgi:hypothetical protein
VRRGGPQAATVSLNSPGFRQQSRIRKEEIVVSERLFVATRKGLFTVERQAGSGRWAIARTAFLGEPISAVFPDPRDDSVYAALNLGHFGVKLHRSRDGGATWAECPVPNYPQLAVAGVGAAVAEGPSLIQIWSLEAGGPDEPGVVWAGTMPGGLFRSPDGGDSWELNRPLWDRPERAEWFGGGADHPGIHSVCVDPRDSRRVAVGVSCAGVWATDDGGGSWEQRASGMWAAYMPDERRNDPNVQDPHRVVQCPGAPDVLWAQHHNAIFRSTDGAGHWDEVQRDGRLVFGFAVAVHPHNPDTAWFVPAMKDEQRYPIDAQLMVLRTRDGGRTFDALRDGLPQEHAYDLGYRHGLDVDASGDRLAFGSTTGNLWLSEDGGDAWQNVSVHLPPIYAVRFAA